MHHLSSEPLVAHPSSLLVVVWYIDISAVQLRCRLRGDYRVAMVPSAEGLLLCNSGSWLCDHSSARDHDHSATDAIPNTTTYAAAYSAGNTFGASRSVQLRC